MADPERFQLGCSQAETWQTFWTIIQMCFPTDFLWKKSEKVAFFRPLAFEQQLDRNLDRAWRETNMNESG